MRFIFVGGCGRSGTTLLQKLLLSHSKIAGGSEFYFGKEIMALYGKMSNDFFLDYNQVYYDKPKVAEEIKSFYSSFFKKWDTAGISYISEKTPTNIEVAQELLDVFPDAFFVNVIRDGRDVVASYLEVGEKYDKTGKPSAINLDYCINLWMDSVKRYNQLKDHPRMYNVFYEDLVTQPEQTLKQLLKFVGLEMEAQMLEPEKISAESVNMQSNQGTEFYSKEMMMQPFNPKRVGSWRKRLGTYEKMKVNFVLSNQLRQLGYQVDDTFFRFNRLFQKVFLGN